MKGDIEGRSYSPLTAAFQANGLGTPDFALFCTRARASRTHARTCALHRPLPTTLRNAARAGDFASLYQEPRVSPYGDILDRLFLSGLRASGMWYGHELSVCWMQTELPPGFAEQMKAAELAQSYDDSGWVRTASSPRTLRAPAQLPVHAASLAPSPILLCVCLLSRVCRAQAFVEATISAGLKVGKRRLDLAKRTKQAMEYAYGGKWSPDSMLESVCATERFLPLLPDEVKRRLEHEKTFTSKADVGVVTEFYRSFFYSAARFATRLDFHGVVQGEKDVQQLFGVLPGFASLTALDLSSNRMGAAGAMEIAAYVKGNAVLKTLDTRHNDISDEAAQELASAVLRSSSLELFSEVPIAELRADKRAMRNMINKSLGPTEAFVIAELVAGTSHLNVIALDEFPLPLKQLRGTDPAKAIDLSGKGLSVLSAIVIAKLLEFNSVVKSIDLRDNSFRAEGWCAIFHTLRKSKRSKIESWDLRGEQVNSKTAKALAQYISAAPFLTSLDLSNDAPKVKAGAKVEVNAFASRRISSEALTLRTGRRTSRSTLDIDLLDFFSVGAEVPSIGIGASGAKALAGALAKGKSILISLDLSNNSIGEAGAEALARAFLSGRLTLTLLNLQCNDIGPKGATALASALASSEVEPALRFITLDTVALPVRQLRGIEPVEMLDFSSKRLGVLSAIMIAKLIECNKALTSLDLNNNAIGAPGAQALIEALASGRAVLTSLNLFGNAIGNDGAIAIADALQSGESVFNLLVSPKQVSV